MPCCNTRLEKESATTSPDLLRLGDRERMRGWKIESRVNSESFDLLAPAHFGLSA
jgi:hypothetical protein